MTGSQLHGVPQNDCGKWKQAQLNVTEYVQDPVRNTPRMELLISRLIRHFLRTTPDTLVQDIRSALHEVGQRFKCPAIVMLVCREGRCIEPIRIAIDAASAACAEEKSKRLADICDHWLMYEKQVLADEGQRGENPALDAIFQAMALRLLL